jgi:hypothetical protein
MKSLRLAAVAALVFSTPALAALDGTNATVAYNFPDLGTVYGNANPSISPFVIGAGVESVVDVEGVTFISVDFTDLGLSLIFNTVLGSPSWNSVAFNGLVFTGSGFSGLSSATLLGSSTFGSGQFTQGDITLVGDQLQLNWAGVPYSDGQRIDISFAAAAVPEPAAWAMLIAGFGLVGATLRRRRAAIA